MIGASESFLRSIETRGLQYSQFLGDKDSSSFGKVKVALEQNLEDRYQVQKEECVGHVQKRLGTALREYKKQRKGLKLNGSKVVSGKGRLTKVIIDKMQNYYGLAIRNNIDNQLEMKRSIKAIHHHLIKSENLSSFEEHQYCPKERNSWCEFWRQELCQNAKCSDDKMLLSVFFNELRPIFERLYKDELLSHYLKGLTQNQNESFNSLLWTTKCPKTKYCGLRRVEIALPEAVSVCNTGAASKWVLMKDMGLKKLGHYTCKSFEMQD